MAENTDPNLEPAISQEVSRDSHINTVAIVILGIVIMISGYVLGMISYEGAYGTLNQAIGNSIFFIPLVLIGLTFSYRILIIIPLVLIMVLLLKRKWSNSRMAIMSLIYILGSTYLAITIYIAISTLNLPPM